MRVICVSPNFNTLNYIWIYKSKVEFLKVFLSNRLWVLLIMPNDFEIWFLIYNMWSDQFSL